MSIDPQLPQALSGGSGGTDRCAAHLPNPRRRRVPVARVAAIGVLAGLLACAAHAQRQAPADLTGVEVKELANAVRVTLKGDGVLNVETNSFFETAWGPDSERSGNWSPKPVRRVHFRLSNCRSRVGAFYNISRYPVSHIEISVPVTDSLGLTLDVDIVLYRPATNSSLKLWEGERFQAEDETGRPVEGMGFDLALAGDKRSVALTVMSDRFPEKPQERVKPGPGRPEECYVAASEGRLTVTARYAPLPRLLSEISALTGERVLIEEGLERTISLHLADVELSQLLQALSATYGVSLTRLNGEWAVGEGVVTGAANYFPSETRRFPLRYLAPVDALDLLPNFLLKYVHTDAEGNALVASGPQMMLDKVAADLNRIDVAPPQIEVSVIAVETSSLREVETAFEASPGSPRMRGDIIPHAGALSYQRLDAESFELRSQVNALAHRGLLRVRAEPKATVLNGRTASLFVGRQRYIQITRQQWQGMVGELKAIPVGVSLKVTPWSGGGDISLEVSPEVTTIDEIDPVNGLPVVGVRRSTANVRLRSGESLLISGLRLAQEERQVRKIPLLGDLPLVGGLFRSRRRTVNDTDLAMFVTAREI